MRRQRNAKIVATLGPASSSPETIESLFSAGADVFRLNLSHGEHADHKARYDIIRALENSVGRPIAVMLDLQGPKLRIGRFKDGGVDLVPGAGFRLDLARKLGDDSRVQLPHREVFAALAPGIDLLLDDGRIRLTIEKSGRDFAETRVTVGGPLSDHKGVNLPQLALPIAALTDKDRRDLQFGLDLGVDWVALSFVQRAADVAEARKLIAGRAAVMTKLEKPAAIEHLDEIIDLSDGIMVARGDLGVELAPENVPGLQKEIVGAARRAGKPVVVATQMLESMVHAATPTRAEASDVATAVYDGADAVMLSAESAAGDYPVESVVMMNRIIRRVEQDPRHRKFLETDRADPEATSADAITAAAAQVAQTIRAAAIVSYSVSGSTTLRAARERPAVPILGLTPKPDIARRLAMAWGVHSVLTEDATDFVDMTERACHVALQHGFAQVGDRLVITAGVPFGTPGSTNTLRIAWVGAKAERRKKPRS
ncbi:MAG: pyruvate kinase [Alphaproteobacteria bacterium]